MHILITGGAGFIGCNAADYFLRRGDAVAIFDNLSRRGAAANLAWLQERHGARLHFVRGDVRDYAAVAAAMAGADAVLHLAGQVAVTTSVHRPREDFEINALGTFNVLEALRQVAPHAALINASTNKVYGGMEQVTVADWGERYGYADLPHGVSEATPLDFHSPYGCSKGAGDQYTIDYARIYGLKTVSLRQSCIYGPRQFGVEDQGWVAHFVIAAVLDRPINVYGDGKQVRDLLHIDDLLRAYDLAFARAEQVAGQAFNLGGGPANALAVWTQFGPLLERLVGRPLRVTYGPWRPGDQRVFIADTRKAARLLGWQPTIAPADGIADLYHWVAAQRALFAAGNW